MQKRQAAAGGAVPWHATAVDAVIERLDTRKSGLRDAEVARRFAASGPNRLSDAEQRGRWEMLAAWRWLEAGEIQVVRGGALRTVPAAALVPGDVLLLRASDLVAPDARVIDAHRFGCGRL